VNDKQRFALAVTVALAGLAIIAGAVENLSTGWSDFGENWYIYVIGVLLVGAAECWLFQEQAFSNAFKSTLTLLLAETSIALFLTVAIVCIPIWQVQHHYAAGLIGADEIPQQVDAYRRTVIQLAGGIVVVTGLYLTWRRIQVTEDGQVTDRFSVAVGQLGNRNIEVRLGGIYALERIAKDSPKDHWTVMETLSAFVRENATEVKIDPKTLRKESSPKTDVQGACTVIRRRQSSRDPKDKRISLAGAQLRYVDLRDAHLAKAILIGADLYRGQLNSAVLSGAVFRGANLSEALLLHADLSRARFHSTKLSGAKLGMTNLSKAEFEGADLSDAECYGADMTNAVFSRTDLTGSQLHATNLSGARFHEMEGFLKDAFLWRTDLRDIEGLTADHLLESKTLYEAKLDSDIREEVANQRPKLLKEDPYAWTHGNPEEFL